MVFARVIIPTFPLDSGTVMLLSGFSQAQKKAALVKWAVQEPDGRKVLVQECQGTPFTKNMFEHLRDEAFYATGV